MGAHMDEFFNRVDDFLGGSAPKVTPSLIPGRDEL
jgi:hypothetical protein